MQAYERAVDSAAATPARAGEALIELQRKTVAEHIQKEQAKDWPGVYGTFTPHKMKLISTWPRSRCDSAA